MATIRDRPIELLIDHHGGQPRMTQGTAEDWSIFQSYVIDYVEFCYEPLQNKKATTGYYPAQWLPENVLDVLTGRKLPSKHHRYIHFSASLYCQNTTPGLTELELTIGPGGHVHQAPEVPTKVHTVWGTMEHQPDGTWCCLYGSEYVPNTGRSQSIRLWSRYPSAPFNIITLFTSAWQGAYDLVSNNCIDYALRCWNLLLESYYKYEDVANSSNKSCVLMCLI